MVLSVPSPSKHPSTDVYWLRQHMPAKLLTIARGPTVAITIDGIVSRHTVGDVLKVSLRTKDVAEAKRGGRVSGSDS